MNPNDVDDDGRSGIVVSGLLGMSVLGIDGGTLRSQILRANGTRIGKWTLQQPENKLGPIDDFCGAGRVQMSVKSGCGIGLMHLASANGTSS